MTSSTHTSIANADARADVRAGRLPDAQYAKNFCDAHPPLNLAQAKLEADRCYYCFDAPCIAACPTGIEIPSFIQRIADNNIRGSAQAILSANPLGGLCARVCPTEVLCEQACVRNTLEDKPVEIGQLQRYATDQYFAKPGAPFFIRAAATGKTVAVVGAAAGVNERLRRARGVALVDAAAGPERTIALPLRTEVGPARAVLAVLELRQAGVRLPGVAGSAGAGEGVAAGAVGAKGGARDAARAPIRRRARDRGAARWRGWPTGSPSPAPG